MSYWDVFGCRYPQISHSAFYFLYITQYYTIFIYITRYDTLSPVFTPPNVQRLLRQVQVSVQGRYPFGKGRL
jgi:hypothetical protein